MGDDRSVMLEDASEQADQEKQDIRDTIEIRAPKRPFAWNQLSAERKARTIIRMGLQLALMVWALRDLRRRPVGEIRGSKRLWTLLAFMQPVGPIAYMIFGRKRVAGS